MNLMINHEILGENHDQPREFWGSLWYIQIWLAAGQSPTDFDVRWEIPANQGCSRWHA